MATQEDAQAQEAQAPEAPAPQASVAAPGAPRPIPVSIPFLPSPGRPGGAAFLRPAIASDRRSRAARAAFSRVLRSAIRGENDLGPADSIFITLIF
jgi:hypothetical protein